MLMDYIGLGLLAVGLGSMQYVLDEGQRRDWFGDDSIVIFTVTAVVGLVGFVIYELFGTTRPIVDLRVLRYRSVAAGAFLGMCLGVSLYGSVLVLPQYVQGSLGFTATDSGALLVLRALPLLFLMPFSARLATSGKIDTRWQIAIGFILLGLSNLSLAFVTTTDSVFWTFLLPLSLAGIGLSQIFVPLTISMINAVEPRDIPASTAFFNLARQIGGSIGIALLVTILSRSNTAYHEALASQIRRYVWTGPPSCSTSRNMAESIRTRLPSRS